MASNGRKSEQAAGLKQLKRLATPVKRQVRLLWLVSALSSVCLWLLYLVLAHWAGAWLTGSEIPQWASIEQPAVAIGLFLGFAGGRYLQLWLRRRCGERLHDSLSQQVFTQLHDKRWALLRQKPLTAWQDVFTRHFPAIEHFLIDYQLQLKLVATLPLMVVLLVLPYSWLIAGLLFFTIPLIPMFMWLVGVGAASVRRKHLQVLDRLGGRFVDRLLGSQTIKLLNQQQSELHNLEQASKLHNKRLAEVLRLAFLSSSVLDFFSTVAMALVAVFVGFSLLGEISVGFYGRMPTLAEGLFLLLLAPAFFAELKNLGRLYHVRAEAIAAADHCLDLLTAESAANTSESISNFSSFELRDFSIAGFDQQPLVQGKLAQLNQGEHILLSGDSGSGKSVLLEALCGLREISGELSINNKPVASLRPLLDRMLFLQQQPVLFPGTVAQNIGLGEGEPEAMRSALQQVGLGEWLSQLPQGLDTEMGDVPMLSGGQRQRLALTRVLLFDAELVLLDEPTAHLSQDEHQSLLQTIRQVLQGRTAIWISHKPMDVSDFSQHWLMDETGQLKQEKLEQNSQFESQPLCT